jgi:POT family proton-dependent oligopeptide transporter
MATTATEDRAFFGHAPGLGLLFLVEMWERFSYYGMRALLVLYLVNVLKWHDADAANLYGTYTGFVWLTPLLGGFLADRWLGTRRSLVIGGLVIASGHFALAFDTMPTFYLGLVLIVVGTGFFKPNVSTMVGQLYRPGDPRRDVGFTIFYMGINLGAAIAPFVTGYFAQSAGFAAILARAGINPTRAWSWAFAAAGVGMLIGLALYLWLRDEYLPGIGLPPSAPWPGAAAAWTTSRTLSSQVRSWIVPWETPEERRRVVALLVMFLFVMLFWVAFEQAGSSLNLFADRYTNRQIGPFIIPYTNWQIGPFIIPSAWFQALSPIFVIVLAPVFALLWQKLRARGREPSTPLKVAIGLAIIGLGFLFMGAAGRIIDSCLAAGSACAVASPVWLVMVYLFSEMGELCVSPVGLSYVTKVAPPRYVALLMGAWFLTNAGGNKFAGKLAALASSIPSHATFFLIPVALSLVAAVLLFFCIPWLNRLTKGGAL